MRVLFLLVFSINLLHSEVIPGVEIFFDEGHAQKYAGKRVGLITNHTGVDRLMRSTVQRFLEQKTFTLVALFSPEHGLFGHEYADDKVAHTEFHGVPVYSLHGALRRPTAEMLRDLDLLIYDVQSIGVRSYTYETTLFYVMEEAAKAHVPVLVLDRPNPINGELVDGPLLEERYRSFIGYIRVPYCHGMTIGELARFFNAEYQIHCDLSVISMKGWNRSMSYRDTGLSWVPPSPNIPEPDTPHFYSSTGLLSGLSLVNVGIGYTLPFKIVGAPWICAQEFADALNRQKMPGVHFQPFFFRPFFGLYKGADCQGILIQITDEKRYRPLLVQYFLMGILKSLYPQEVLKRIEGGSRELFHKANGTAAVYQILLNEKYPAHKLIALDREERRLFLKKRQNYLLY